MIADLKPYPAMKEAGLVWLGSVPDHWRIMRGKALLRPIDIRSATGNEELLTVSSRRGVIPRRSANVTMFKAESYVGYKLCWPGDLVINSLWAWSRGLGVTQHHGIVSNAYGVYRPRNLTEIHPRFLHELVRSAPFHWELRVRSKGVWTSRLQLTDDAFLGAPFPVPPCNEQVAIVRFLDQADRKIRRYIRAKQKAIELLDEQKKAAIHRAITRGVDGPTPVKASGFEWLGEIPTDWTTVSLGRALLRIEQGWSPVAAEGLLAEDQWAVLTLSSVRHGTFNASAHKPVPEAASIPERLAISEGDLLLTRSNTRELVGDTCLVSNPRPRTLLCDLIYRLTPDPDVLDTGFLMLQLLGWTGRYQIERDARGSSGTMPKIAQRHIRSWVVVVPPINKQQQITEVISHQLETINESLKLVREEIARMTEFRTRMIADIVTGRLDVRQAATQIPDETDEVVDDWDGAPVDEQATEEALEPVLDDAES